MRKGLDRPGTVVVMIGTSLALAACQTVPPTGAENGDAAQKITFDLDQFDENGLYGPPSGKRSLDYEFCIPEGPAFLEKVRAIDPSITFLPDSPGRIGCLEDQILALGNTHQADFRLILMELANLEYVERIQRVDWE